MFSQICHLAALLSIPLSGACTSAESRPPASNHSTPDTIAIAIQAERAEFRPVASDEPTPDTVAIALTAERDDPRRAAYSVQAARPSHFRHIRTMVTDFYYNWTPRARDITARRFDMVIGGDIREWKRRNPNVRHLLYQLHWNVPKPKPGDDRYATFVRWVKAQPNCELENAFLHKPGTSKIEANRLEIHIWTSDRWVFNPADPCWRRYKIEALRALQRRGHDGVFYDEYGTGTFGAATQSLEFGSSDAYFEALTDALRGKRAAIGPDFLIMLNTAEYMRPADAAMIDAAGGTHLELFNDLTHGDMASRWNFIEQRLANGVIVELVGRKNWTAAVPSSIMPGNYADARRNGFHPGMYRLKMGELASYYMVRPTDPSNFYLDTNNDNWKVSPTAHWLEAQTVDVGDPIERRRMIVDTTGPDGQAVRIWRREYTNSLILARPSADWENSGYGDASGYTLALPTGQRWRLLQHDGSLGPAMSEITLRKGEGAILMKE